MFAATPPPDPAPHSGNRPVKIDWAYDYWSPYAIDFGSYILRGYGECLVHVPVHGKRYCVRFRP